MELIDQDCKDQELEQEEECQGGGDCGSCVNKDPMICFCYRLTAGQLQAAYQKAGSLAVLQEETKAGRACGGCRVILHSMFNEEPSDINEVARKPAIGTSCSKPGSRTMKGYIIATGDLESVVYSSNAVAPQFGDCDATMTVNYALVDHRAQPIFIRQQVVKTNDVFVFDTRKENLPRPFYGMFFYELDRNNYGASRFNIYWTNGRSTTSTHENNDPGRPRVFLPLVATKDFLSGPTNVYMGIMNPHDRRLGFKIDVFNLDDHEQKITRPGYLDPYNSTWIDVNQYLYKPALDQFPQGRFVLKLQADQLNIPGALVEYMFFYNKQEDIWTSNHL